MSVPPPVPGCAYCGLPLASGWLPVRPAETADAPHYCCFGCRFAAAVAQASGEQGAVVWLLTRLGLAIFFTVNVLVFTMFQWGQDVYGPAAGPQDGFTQSLDSFHRYLAMLLAAPVLLLLGGPLAENTWDQLRRGRLTADLLLLSGVLASYLYSVHSVWTEAGPIYFEVGCLVLVLVTLGRWLEAAGKVKANAALEALERLLPETVRRQERNAETIVPRSEARPGDNLRVLPGERVPCDGRLLAQSVAVDERLLTGESKPVTKTAGDPLVAGSLVLDGTVLLEVTAPSSAGTIARLAELVRSARRSKGRYERLADRVTAWFLPGVLLLALLACLWHGCHRGWDQGILTGLAVVLIACPCALGIATPLALWTALGEAARQQILFTQAEALEKLAVVRTFCLDKTGTLTTDTPQVIAWAVVEEAERAEILRRTAALAGHSLHHHSLALADFAAPSGMKMISPVNPRTLPGRGLVGTFERSEETWLGSVALMQEAGLRWSRSLEGEVQTAVKLAQPCTCLGWGGQVRAVFRLTEQLRPEATEAVAGLCQRGLHVEVLTGDHAARGAALAAELGIPVQAALTPEGKLHALTALRQNGLVAMVGDGINDAPALAASDVGIAMGCGTDVTRATAALCLLGNDLRKLPWAVDLARRTVGIIRQNLFWAFVYNALGIGLACTGWLNPIWAAAAMTLSSGFVVANSLRLRQPEGTP
jgi:heavy metal translocating P-type ATPase